MISFKPTLIPSCTYGVLNYVVINSLGPSDAYMRQ